MRAKWQPLLLCVGLSAGCDCGGGHGADADGSSSQNGSSGVGGSGQAGDEADEGSAEGENASGSCVSDEAFWRDEVWGAVLVPRCLGCHAEGALAESRGAEFLLKQPGEPDATTVNAERVADFLKREADGESLLLTKARGELAHGGGEVVEAGGSEEAAFVEYLQRIEMPETCDSPDIPSPSIADLDLEPPERTLYKAALQFATRLPTDAEMAAVRTGNDNDLRAALRALLDEEAFYGRLKVLYNDVLLTDKYAVPVGGFVEVSGYSFPGEPLDDLDDRTRRNFGISKEPLELIAYIVRNDRPFTEILTADYIMVNPDSARTYGADITFEDPEDPNEFHPARIDVRIMAGGFSDFVVEPLPHAGLLTSPMFLSRFPTTSTNRNRHRARMLLDIFLGVDIFDIAAQPIDAGDLSEFDVPTQDNPNCSVCHDTLDPIAGGFHNWDYDDGLQSRRVRRPWYEDMAAPGYADIEMPESQRTHAEQWLAQRITNDPRFAYGTVRTLYRVVMGRQSLKAPAAGEVDFANKLANWAAQEEELRRLAARFEAGGFDFKTLLTDLLLSPVYRARNSVWPSFGTDRLLTPAELAEKIHLTTGWRFSGSQEPTGSRDYLSDAYYFRLLYGGIDSNNITERAKDMSALMASVAQRAGHVVGCQAVPMEFGGTIPTHLFPYVDATDTPDDTVGQSAIRENLAYMHRRMLGEAPSSADVDVAFNLFRSVRSGGLSRMDVGDEPSAVPFYCASYLDLVINVRYDGRLQDEDYVQRAWMAVVSYYVSHSQFLVH